MIFTIHRTITAYRELEEDGITQDMMNDKFLLGRRSSDESDEGNSTVQTCVEPYSPEIIQCFGSSYAL